MNVADFIINKEKSGPFYTSAPGTKVNIHDGQSMYRNTRIGGMEFETPKLLDPSQNINDLNTEKELKYSLSKDLCDAIGQHYNKTILPTLPNLTVGGQQVYVDNPGLWNIKEVRLQQNSNVFWRVPITRKFVHCWLNTLDPIEKAKILDYTGGTAPTGGLIYSPIVDCFSKLLSNNSNGTPDIPLYDCDTPITLTLVMCAGSELLAAGNSAVDDNGVNAFAENPQYQMYYEAKRVEEDLIGHNHAHHILNSTTNNFCALFESFNSIFHNAFYRYRLIWVIHV